VQILAASDTVPKGIFSGDNQKSFTRRLVSAVQSLQAQGTMLTTTALFQVARLHPKRGLMPVLKTLGGTNLIIFAFETPFGRNTSNALVRTRPQTNSETILTKITIKGDTDEALDAFKLAIARLPANMNVEITQAYKTDGSNFFCLLRMFWEAWALGQPRACRYHSRISGIQLI
jgi:hypothetical protein